ncbi:MAG: hypothetical protein ACI9NN_001521 [Bacteroidia bacterium]|jgi:hypothetical protein
MKKNQTPSFPQLFRFKTKFNLFSNQGYLLLFLFLASGCTYYKVTTSATPTLPTIQGDEQPGAW